MLPRLPPPQKNYDRVLLKTALQIHYWFINLHLLPVILLSTNRYMDYLSICLLGNLYNCALVWLVLKTICEIIQKVCMYSWSTMCIVVYMPDCLCIYLVSCLDYLSYCPDSVIFDIYQYYQIVKKIRQTSSTTSLATMKMRTSNLHLTDSTQLKILINISISYSHWKKLTGIFKCNLNYVLDCTQFDYSCKITRLAYHYCSFYS